MATPVSIISRVISTFAMSLPSLGFVVPYAKCLTSLEGEVGNAKH